MDVLKAIRTYADERGRGLCDCVGTSTLFQPLVCVSLKLLGSQRAERIWRSQNVCLRGWSGGLDKVCWPKLLFTCL